MFKEFSNSKYSAPIFIENPCTALTCVKTHNFIRRDVVDVDIINDCIDVMFCDKRNDCWSATKLKDEIDFMKYESVVPEPGQIWASKRDITGQLHFKLLTHKFMTPLEYQRFSSAQRDDVFSFEPIHFPLVIWNNRLKNHNISWDSLYSLTNDAAYIRYYGNIELPSVDTNIWELLKQAIEAII